MDDKVQGEREPDGRYTPRLDRVCRCGHTLGSHLAAGPVKDRACCECDCQGFRKAAK